METQFNFQESVLDRSHEKPVLVDFWAAWCGPCRVLGPVIEKIAEEQIDRWELVKIDTEAEQEIAQAYRIMSIPSVKLFYKGDVIAEFNGALPRASILRWLDENLPDDRKGELQEILQAFEGKDEIDKTPLETFVQKNPDLQEGRLALAKLISLSEPTRAQELLAEIRAGNPLFEQAEDVRLLTELHLLEPSGQAVSEALLHARSALVKHDNETAIKAVIQAVMIDKSFQKGLPRRLAIALFRSWGPQHELTKEYRKRFDMALY